MDGAEDEPYPRLFDNVNLRMRPRFLQLNYSYPTSCTNMKWSLALPGLLATSHVAAMPQSRMQSQAILSKDPPKHIGVGHFSEWSRATKKAFLMDWQAGKSSEWTIVMGNEGGDLDSMTAARRAQATTSPSFPTEHRYLAGAKRRRML